MSTKCENFFDLPKGLRVRIEALGQPNKDDWVKQPVPALNGKSLLECFNEENGYAKVCEYLNKVEGYLR